MMTFGNNERHHLQACFCVYSFLAANARLSSVNIMTDQPGFYKNIENRVKVMPVTTDILREWEGEHHFFWRVKIKAIEKLCGMYPGEPVMYLDTDTFLFRDFEEAYHIVTAGNACMHEYEAPLKQLGTKTGARMYRQLEGKRMAGVDDVSAKAMWNAGVVLTPNTHGVADIRLALALCDEMLAAGVTPVLVEQYSLAIALDHFYGLKPAAGFIAHFWSTKELWNELISSFFHRCYLRALTQDETIAAFRELELGKLPVRHKVRTMNRKLRKIIDRMLPPKNPVFIAHSSLP